MKEKNSEPKKKGDENRPYIKVLCGFHSGVSSDWWQRTFYLSGEDTMGRENDKFEPDIAVPRQITTFAPLQGLFITKDGVTSYHAAPDTVNPLYKGDVPLLQGKGYELKDEDVLVLYGDDSREEYADVFFIYFSGRTKNALSIDIRDRSVMENGHRKYLLRDIKADIPQGHMVLVLGGSGAGKTTFMNAVMGYEPANGVIRYKDADIYKNFEKMKYEIGYVPQQDLLRLSDTVYNTLLDAAKMRLPRDHSDNDYKAAVEQTMRMLGLKKEEKTRVDKLSGGQRKRLSIATEYIGNPSLFFLDEPDSGLDSGMATELMRNLRAIADQGKIIIVISHSPNRVAEVFDDIVVLAKSEEDNCGYLAFYGASDDACDFFGVSVKENADIEGIVSRINRKEEGGEGLGDHYIKMFRERKDRN